MLINSCSQVPQPMSYPYSTMRKMQSARHWQVLAEDVAEQMIEAVGTLSANDPFVFYVQPEQGDFNVIFRDSLVENLLKLSQEKGRKCNIKAGDPDAFASDAYVIEYDVYVVRHRADRFQRPPLGLITLAGTAIRVARNVGENAIIPAAVFLDVAIGAVSDLPNHEVVIKIAVKKGSNYAFMRNDVYYINDADVSHYRNGEKKNGTTKTKQFTIVGDDE